MFIVVKFQKKIKFAALLGLIVSISLIVTPTVRAEGINPEPTAETTVIYHEDSIDSPGTNDDADHIDGLSPSCSSNKDSVTGEDDKCGDNLDEINAEEKPTTNNEQPIEEDDVIIEAEPEIENNQSNLPADLPEVLWQYDINANNTSLKQQPLPISIFSIKTSYDFSSYLSNGSSARKPMFY